MRQRGFTLWELLVTVMVIGIVLGIGVPNFQAFSRNGDIASAVNALVSAVHLSRTEAVKRQLPVTLCGTTTPLAAAPACDGGTGGFFSFVDDDRDGVFDGGEQILLRRDAPASQITTAIDGPGLARFGPDGFLDRTVANQLSRVMYCDDRGNVAGPGGESVARVVAISATGRPQLLRDIASVSNFVSTTGSSCP